ncbi:MAG: tRNA dihydrouridine synthase DusB [Candidatus Cloacimonetes bacterium]|nr:tRNA dihydrouridine synthase DusB [Candidatus Cloacimonadota bacterium]
MNSIFSNKTWLAPLAGYTDTVYRKICKSMGADVVMSEMISADALIYKNPKTKILAEFDEEERPIGLQIFGNDAHKISEGIKILKEYQPDFIDINMGCPIKKIVKNGSGGALLKNPEKIKEIVSSAVKVIDNEFPLTIKIRSGWNSDESLLEIVKIIESEGASGICLHPRTKTQMFSGKSNWDLIRKVKEKTRIPIIGNGDIKTPEDAKKMVVQTGCDSIMIGRGVIGNPWLFRQIKNYLQNKTYNSILPSKKIEMIFLHFEKLKKKIGSKIALKSMRKFIPYYTKGMKNASKLRQKCNQTSDEMRFIQYLLDFKVGLKNG